VHGNIDDSGQDGEYQVVRFYSFLELEIFVPEWMSQEVKAYTSRATLEKSRWQMSAQSQPLGVREKGRRKQTWMRYMYVGVMITLQSNLQHEPRMDNDGS
jgi:hypothetical protein